MITAHKKEKERADWCMVRVSYISALAKTEIIDMAMEQSLQAYNCVNHRDRVEVLEGIRTHVSFPIDPCQTCGLRCHSIKT